MAKRVIEKEDFIGGRRRTRLCDYVLAYFKKHNLNIGDTWDADEYSDWIIKKHEDFRKEHNLEYRGYNDKEQELFNEYILK